MDYSALPFLTASALDAKRKLEEEEKDQEGEEGEGAARRRWTWWSSGGSPAPFDAPLGLDTSLPSLCGVFGARRKRKKRRKRKVPKASSRSSRSSKSGHYFDVPLVTAPIGSVSGSPRSTEYSIPWRWLRAWFPYPVRWFDSR